MDDRHNQNRSAIQRAIDVTSFAAITTTPPTVEVLAMTSSTTIPTRRAHPLGFVLARGLIAGTLDIVYACIFWSLKRDVPAQRILQSVAAGLLGDGGAAFGGGTWIEGSSVDRAQRRGTRPPDRHPHRALHPARGSDDMMAVQRVPR